MKLIILGATGLVGKKTLSLALNHPKIKKVIVLSRRPLFDHPKLETHIINFEAPPQQGSFWQADALICALGTTIKTAGSQEKFYRVDHDYPFELARIAKENGVECFVLNSATGADPQSRFFYNRVKGELERDLQNLKFSSLTLVRPGLIGGDRQELRRGEEVAKKVAAILQPVLPKKWQTNPPENIANQMLQAALTSKPGVHVINSEQIVRNQEVLTESRI